MTTSDIYTTFCSQNMFIYIGLDWKTGIWNEFVVSKWRNNFNEFIEYLENIDTQVGYDNENYHYPLIHYIIEMRDSFINISPEGTANLIYSKSQQIKNEEFSFIHDKDKYIRQIDLFRMWHLNYSKKYTSIYDLQFALNVPISYIQEYIRNKASDEIRIARQMEYQILAMYKLYNISLGKSDNQLYKDKNIIKFREHIRLKYKIDCISYPNVRLGEAILLKLYSKEVGKSEFEVKGGKTSQRSYINLHDCIPSWTKFNMKCFNDIKESFDELVVDCNDLKSSVSLKCNIGGYIINYGLGGAHGSNKAGIYTSDDNHMIINQDVGSMYPSISVTLGLCPEHLDKKAFCKVYKSMVDARIEEKKKPEKERNEGFLEETKYIINNIYGKSNEPKSFLYDTLYTLKTAVAGQMFLSMWTENLIKAIPGIKFLQHNSDGITYMIDKKYYDNAISVSNDIMKQFDMYIETTLYSKLIMKDVNNYIAIKNDGKPILKGCFAKDKIIWKDSSARIIPIALENYFVNNISVKDTITDKNNNIFDYCIRHKSGENPSIYQYVENNSVITENLGPTSRFIITKSGGAIIQKGKNINKTFNCRLYNIPVNNFDKNDINYGYYMSEANKIINQIESTQLSLF